MLPQRTGRSTLSPGKQHEVSFLTQLPVAASAPCFLLLQPEDIQPSELHSPLPLGQECCLCLRSLPNEGSTVTVILHFSTVVWLLGQPHKYITVFLHK